MKTAVTLSIILIFGWVALVTFFGPEVARAINAPEAKKPRAPYKPRSL